MSRKKTYKKESNLVKWIISGLLVVFMFFSVTEKMDSRLQRMSISIKTRTDKKQLISKKEVKQILDAHLGYDLSLAKFSDLDVINLEKLLNNDERISKAEIFIDKHNKMHIGIIQNLPIVRIEVTGVEDYYLDYHGERISKEDDNIRVPVVTGSIDPFQAGYQEDSNNNLNDILKISKKIYEDDFLTALVDQIHISENDDIILIPKLGRQRIALGPSDNLDDKIYKLKTYYEKGIKQIGLDKFEELNLRYDGQIVGVKKES